MMAATGTAKEEKKDDDSDKIGNIGAKRGKKKRGGIEMSVPKEKEATALIIQNVNICIYFHFSKKIDTNYVLG